MPSTNHIVVPTIKINPRRFTIYQQWQGNNRSKDGVENLIHDGTKYKGFLSDNAKRRMKTAVDWFVNITNTPKVIEIDGKKVEFKSTFITLTLPASQKHTDTEIKRKCFSPFLDELRKYHKLKVYIWRAERQVNGSIHFHLAADIGLHYMKVRKIWNRHINHLGYVDRYTQKHKKLSFEQYCKLYPRAKNNKKSYEFGKSTAWKQPNSTDIHRTQNVDDMAAYITKYMTKEEESNQAIKGRIWFVCRAISKIQAVNSFPIDFQMQDELLPVIAELKRESFQLKTGEVMYRAVELEHAIICLLDVRKYVEYGMNTVFDCYKRIFDFIKGIRELEIDPEQLMNNFYKPAICQEKSDTAKATYNYALPVQKEIFAG